MRDEAVLSTVTRHAVASPLHSPPILDVIFYQRSLWLLHSLSVRFSLAQERFIEHLQFVLGAAYAQDSEPILVFPRAFDHWESKIYTLNNYKIKYKVMSYIRKVLQKRLCEFREGEKSLVRETESSFEQLKTSTEHLYVSYHFGHLT